MLLARKQCLAISFIVIGDQDWSYQLSAEREPGETYKSKRRRDSTSRANSHHYNSPGITNARICLGELRL